MNKQREEREAKYPWLERKDPKNDYYFFDEENLVNLRADPLPCTCGNWSYHKERCSDCKAGKIN